MGGKNGRKEERKEEGGGRGRGVEKGGGGWEEWRMGGGVGGGGQRDKNLSLFEAEFSCAFLLILILRLFHHDCNALKACHVQLHFCVFDVALLTCMRWENVKQK